jgi:hypothetical protein
MNKGTTTAASSRHRQQQQQQVQQQHQQQAQLAKATPMQLSGRSSPPAIATFAVFVQRQAASILAKQFMLCSPVPQVLTTVGV